MPPSPTVTAILPTRNPHCARLRATLAALAGQTLPRSARELIVVDNGSVPALTGVEFPELAQLGACVQVEPQPGLTPARLAGIRAARGEVIVFVDDDNVLAPDYLQHVVRRFSDHPRLGAGGGPVVPEWETPPPAWIREFHGLLALRDLGLTPRFACGEPDAPWPDFAPVGAGLAVRRAAVETYVQALAREPGRRRLDRAGPSLASGGDNDLVFTILHDGWDVGYFPELKVTHLIPRSRLSPDYLGRLNEGIMRTWVSVLALHGQCPWPPIPCWTVPVRAGRAWWRDRPWTSPAARIRWRGHVGQFLGQADLGRLSVDDHRT